ncbi:Uu.00g032390.m01.CDS01 [Anthostomella pinea]|uniref:Uu.00g032390.m01.CDS01 n=1 Tax=Anthostomella pinea TaxID=933095 RepID=A0AAI8YD31_9PEZI|nr:Uu.00g032390.m01.CDS01 [Anthostomella pinea]
MAMWEYLSPGLAAPEDRKTKAWTEAETIRLVLVVLQADNPELNMKSWKGIVAGANATSGTNGHGARGGLYAIAAIKGVRQPPACTVPMVMAVPLTRLDVTTSRFRCNNNIDDSALETLVRVGNDLLARIGSNGVVGTLPNGNTKFVCYERKIDGTGLCLAAINNDKKGLKRSKPSLLETLKSTTGFADVTVKYGWPPQALGPDQHSVALQTLGLSEQLSIENAKLLNYRPLGLWLNSAYAKYIVKGNFMTLSARPKAILEYQKKYQVSAVSSSFYSFGTTSRSNVQINVLLRVIELDSGPSSPANGDVFVAREALTSIETQMATVIPCMNEDYRTIEGQTPMTRCRKRSPPEDDEHRLFRHGADVTKFKTPMQGDNSVRLSDELAGYYGKMSDHRRRIEGKGPGDNGLRCSQSILSFAFDPGPIVPSLLCARSCRSACVQHARGSFTVATSTSSTLSIGGCMNAVLANAVRSFRTCSSLGRSPLPRTEATSSTSLSLVRNVSLTLLGLVLGVVASSGYSGTVRGAGLVETSMIVRHLSPGLIFTMRLKAMSQFTPVRNENVFIKTGYDEAAGNENAIVKNDGNEDIVIKNEDNEAAWDIAGIEAVGNETRPTPLQGIPDVRRARAAWKNADDTLKNIMEVVNINGDGKIKYESRHRFRVFIEAAERQLFYLFKKIDRDRDGRVDKEELHGAPA